MKKRVVWNFRHWSKKKTVIIQALSLCTIRDISSALERSGSTLRKHLAFSSQGRSERTARLPRVDGYWSCLLSLIQRAHLQPYRAICRVSILEYILAYLHIYFFKYTLVLFRIWMCTYIYACTQGFCTQFHFTLTYFSHISRKEFNSNSSVFCIKQIL